MYLTFFSFYFPVRLPHHKLLAKAPSEWELGSPAPAHFAVVTAQGLNIRHLRGQFAIDAVDSRAKTDRNFVIEGVADGWLEGDHLYFGLGQRIGSAAGTSGAEHPSYGQCRGNPACTCCRQPDPVLAWCLQEGSWSR